ncbi:hypothetical protein P4639_14655 [Priestia megaterium]|uniref:hypothetical protein n=1 Tax=Priestia megaterium TaxID=1404 RepID=UPI002E1CE515|nr:hypothetical protein [Priestia megaterium]
MSSTCTCHINPEYCWWCMYEEEKKKNEKLKTAFAELLKDFEADAWTVIHDRSVNMEKDSAELEKEIKNYKKLLED